MNDHYAAGRAAYTPGAPTPQATGQSVAWWAGYFTAMRDDMNPRSYLPAPPPGYEYSLAKKRNLICAFHPQKPILYLDERTMEWRELDRYVSEVHPAQTPSKS